MTLYFFLDVWNFFLSTLLQSNFFLTILHVDTFCRAGCGRATRILWMQQRVERKELMVGPVASSENVADIGPPPPLVMQSGP